ncbi:hypothetical protein JCM5350_002840 [Sporobolomyces pararoseus]
MVYRYPPAPVQPPVVNEDPRHGLPSRPSRAQEINKQSWRNWTVRKLVPTVEDFVRSHGSTTLPLVGGSAPLGANLLGSNYQLCLDEVLFREELPRYPLGLPDETPAVVEVRLPGIRIETATLPPEHVLVPAPAPSVGLHPAQPVRQSVMFLPSNSRRQLYTERAGPRVFEHFEHIPSQFSVLPSYPIQCRAEHGSMDLLEGGQLSGEAQIPWTYLFGTTYWTAVDPLSVSVTSNWHVRFYEPSIIADITFEVPPFPRPHAPPQVPLPFQPQQR